jgi:hypothetical protein
MNINIRRVSPFSVLRGDRTEHCNSCDVRHKEKYVRIRIYRRPEFRAMYLIKDE